MKIVLTKTGIAVALIEKGHEENLFDHKIPLIGGHPVIISLPGTQNFIF